MHGRRLGAMAPHYMVLDSLDQHRLEADIASIDEILNEVADSALLNSQERCILAWELSLHWVILLMAPTDVGMAVNAQPRMCEP